ncbi:MAG: hypothetical protein KF878_20995 [Planctomycetes bacterium]|nr:hypothetical protein [Planctomycetota bacterium]
MSTKKGAPRRCPLCAATVKADALECRTCGSNLARVAGLGQAKATSAAKGDDEAWPAPAAGDVGLTGLGAVVGALAGFGLGVWIVGPGLLPLVVVVGAAGGAAGGAALGRAGG